MSENENLKQEIVHLSAECDRLRSQRDAYKDELDGYRGEIDRTVSAQLQLLSARLSEEIREGFFSTLKRIAWGLGIVAVVATVGGLITISDLITARIDEAVDEREADITRLREGVIQALVEFKLEAAKALDEIAQQKAQVAEHAMQARRDITARVSPFTIGVDAPSSLQVAATADPGAGVAVWFGDLPQNTIGIAGSRADQVGYEKLLGGNFRGAFSYHFIRLLAEASTDANKDGQVSLWEAVFASQKELATERTAQNPVILGEGQSVSLFATAPIQEAERPALTLRVALVGINNYVMLGGDLRGPVNDVRAFQSALSDRTRLMAKNVQIRTLTDDKATLSAIQDAVKWLTVDSASDDVSLLYYSGHVSTVLVADETGESVEGANRVKAIVPHDGDWRAGRFIEVPKLAESLSNSKGRVVLVIDG